MPEHPPSKAHHILVVDDEPLVRESLSEMLSLTGYSASTASNGKQACDILKNTLVDILITDIKMPEMDGNELLRFIKKNHPEIAVIIMTSYGSIGNAVEAMKGGAYDYITKPIVDSEIKISIERLLKQKQLIEENARLKEQLQASKKKCFAGIFGEDSKMQKIYSLIEAVSNTRATVLINGESGTGKRLIAHAIHKCNESERNKPFIEVSCGALTESLLESELFGHVKGSFTGAIKDRAGRFELANHGTIFLDEIDAFPPALQVKLLRVLQDGEFERVGDSKTVKVDIRIIAATNQNLEELITQGKFRKDLFYRLNIISIEVPPLRNRKSDIPILVEEFIRKHSGHRKNPQSISEEALLKLMEYNWPGNIRELENVIERAMVLNKGDIINAVDLPDALHKSKPTEAKEGKLCLKDALKNPEKDLIKKALDSVKWNRNEAAKILDINRTTLYKKMQKYGFLKSVPA
jgi:DNA-binding NtrC family response regulator